MGRGASTGVLIGGEEYAGVSIGYTPKARWLSTER